MKPHKGQFQPGNRANPKGRPTDSVKAATLRKRILRASPEVIDALVDAAKAGDVNAGRALLVCAVPPLKPAELPVTLPIDGDAGLADQGRAVVSALAGGLIAPGQAASILQALAGVARLIELSEFEKRLTALEQQSGGEHGVGPDWRGLVRPAVVYVDEPLPE